MDKSCDYKFIDHMKSVMKRKEIKQIDLAEKIGVPISSLRFYLSKDRQLPFCVAMAIAVELKIDLNSLYGIDDNPMNKDEYVAYQEFKRLFTKHKNIK